MRRCATLIGRRELSDDARHRLLDLLEQTPATRMRHSRTLPHELSLKWLRKAPLHERTAHASSPFWFMRAAVASGQDLPDDLAERLRNDPDADVAVAAHAHPSTPATRLTALVFGTPRPMGIQRFLRHPSFPIARLTEMATGPDERREDVARHPEIAPDLLVALTRDPVPSSLSWSGMPDCAAPSVRPPSCFRDLTARLLPE